MPAAVLLRLGRRYISRRILQSLLFVLGVTLGVAMVIAIDLANASATRAFDLTAESISGRATHQIIGGPAGLDEDIYRRLRISTGGCASNSVCATAPRSSTSTCERRNSATSPCGCSASIRWQSHPSAPISLPPR